MKLKKTKLIEQLAIKADHPAGFQSDKEKLEISRATVELFFDFIKDALKQDDRVEIRGFGSFSARHHGSYTGRNPKTGEPVEVPAKRTPFFRISTTLKKKIDTLSSKKNLP
jgi:integration host factor subunit beta